MLSVGRSLLSCSVYAVGRKWNFPRDASDSSCRIKKPFNFPSGRPGCCARLFLNNNPLPLHPPRRSSTHLRLANPVVPCNRWRSWSPEWSRYFFESQANAPELNRIPDEDGPRLSGGTGALWHANHRNAHGSLETSSFFFFFLFPFPAHGHYELCTRYVTARFFGSTTFHTYIHVYLSRAPDRLPDPPHKFLITDYDFFPPPSLSPNIHFARNLSRSNTNRWRVVSFHQWYRQTDYTDRLLS